MLVLLTELLDFLLSLCLDSLLVCLLLGQFGSKLLDGIFKSFLLGLMLLLQFSNLGLH